MSRSDPVALAPRAATELASSLASAGHDLEGRAQEARRLLLTVERPSGAPALLEDVARWAHQLAGDLTERIDRVVRLELASPLVHHNGAVTQRYLDVRGIGRVDDLLLALVELGALPACPRLDEVAARGTALTALSRDVQQALAEQAPEAIGAADGVPFALRDRANRRLLQRHITRLGRRGSTLGPSQRRLLRDLRGWRDEPDLQVVKLDVERGRVVLARGDLDAASHVAVIIPGAGATLDGISRRHGAWMDHLHATMGQRLTADGADGAAATVLWLDYDAPSRLVPGAVRRDAATDAARRLPDFLDGVAAAGPQLVTTIGHSYGSVVLGRSLADHRGRLAADQLIALGSPGLGVQLSRELGLRDDQRMLAATFDEDPIAHAGRRSPMIGDIGRAIHGPDPRRLQAVETISLSTHDLVDADPVERHLQYLDGDSSALRLVGDLAAGSGRRSPG